MIPILLCYFIFFCYVLLYEFHSFYYYCLLLCIFSVSILCSQFFFLSFYLHDKWYHTNKKTERKTENTVWNHGKLIYLTLPENFLYFLYLKSFFTKCYFALSLTIYNSILELCLSLIIQLYASLSISSYTFCIHVW